MDVRFEPLSEKHRPGVIGIFNHYIARSYAAFLDLPVPSGFFDLLLKMTQGYPALAAVDDGGEVVGYGLFRSHNPLPVFAKAAEFTCFLDPDTVGQGVGSALLRELEGKGRERGIRVVLACISSLNEPSIRFHEKNGFTRCGTFHGVGEKFGTPFDLVWMEKKL
jgi:L-amino acid N-acyltransferase YncA